MPCSIMTTTLRSTSSIARSLRSLAQFLVWVFSSGTYGFIGDPATGIARAQRATRLAPLGYQAFFNLCLLAQNHYLNGDLEMRSAGRASR